MSDRPLDADERVALAVRIDGWLAEQQIGNPAVAAVEADVDGPQTWFVRMKGEDKDVYTIRLRLDQRTLAYETFVMPAPQENHADFYAYLLRQNLKMFGLAFAIGEEDAIFLSGQIDNRDLDGDAVDRILGTMYAWVEQCFRTALRIGYASKFR